MTSLLDLARAGAVILLASGCWGYPRLSIRAEEGAAGRVLAFGYCSPTVLHPPGLTDISVHEVDASARAVGPALCSLTVRPSTVPGYVPAWRYGAPVPGMDSQRCAPLRPSSTYRISIGGGGVGTALLHTDAAGTVASVEDSCR
jgi:hypothetical protein